MKREDEGVKKYIYIYQTAAAALVASETGGGCSCSICRQLLPAAAGKKGPVVSACCDAAHIQRAVRCVSAPTANNAGRRGDIKSGLLQEKHPSDGTVSVLLVSGGGGFFFFDSLLWSQGSLFSTKKGLKTYKRSSTKPFERPSAWEESVSLPHLLMTFLCVNSLIRD